MYLPATRGEKGLLSRPFCLDPTADSAACRVCGSCRSLIAVEQGRRAGYRRSSRIVTAHSAWTWANASIFPTLFERVSRGAVQGVIELEPAPIFLIDNGSGEEFRMVVGIGVEARDRVGDGGLDRRGTLVAVSLEIRVTGRARSIVHPDERSLQATVVMMAYRARHFSGNLRGVMGRPGVANLTSCSLLK